MESSEKEPISSSPRVDAPLTDDTVVAPPSKLLWTEANDDSIHRKAISFVNVSFQYPLSSKHAAGGGDDDNEEEEEEEEVVDADDSRKTGDEAGENDTQQEDKPDTAAGGGGGAAPSLPRGALKELTLDIPRGSFLGIVGPSGGGKSTLLKMLKRLYDPEIAAAATGMDSLPTNEHLHDGVPPAASSSTTTAAAAPAEVASAPPPSLTRPPGIYVDHRPMTVFDVASLRQRIAWVPQHPIFYDELTILENLTMGMFHPHTDIQRCCEAACIHNVIVAKSPQGYLDKVAMSGGEKQRLAIARALLARPSVLLLDEATSALDAVTERDVLRGIMKECQYQKKHPKYPLGGSSAKPSSLPVGSAEPLGMTIVSVAHRLASLRAATHIAVIQGGACVEFGSPKELLKRKGTGAGETKSKFRELWDAQRLTEKKEHASGSRAALLDEGKSTAVGEEIATAAAASSSSGRRRNVKDLRQEEATTDTTAAAAAIAHGNDGDDDDRSSESSSVGSSLSSDDDDETVDESNIVGGPRKGHQANDASASVDDAQLHAHLRRLAHALKEQADAAAGSDEAEHASDVSALLELISEELNECD